MLNDDTDDDDDSDKDEEEEEDRLIIPAITLLVDIFNSNASASAVA
jgi:hypothetical protein